MDKKDLSIDEYQELIERRAKGETIKPSDLDLLLKKTAEDMRDYAKNKGAVGPMDYVAKIIGMETSALNSYFFTSYGVFQKDIAEKVKPYVAYTISLIHALNLGYLLGTLKKGDELNGNTTDKTDNK